MHMRALMGNTLYMADRARISLGGLLSWCIMRICAWLIPFLAAAAAGCCGAVAALLNKPQQ